MRRHALICPTAICAGLLGACSGPQVLTATDQQAILTALAHYEESQGVEPVLAWHIRPEIRAKKGQTWAKYHKSRPMEQLQGVPTIVELKKNEEVWSVVSEESDWPWWRRIVGHTVGVK